MTTALLDNEIQLTWFGISSTRPLVADNRIKPLAYGGSKRSPYNAPA